MTYKDTALYIKLKVLSWITYDHLEIKMSNQVDEMWVIISSSEIMQTQPPPLELPIPTPNLPKPIGNRRTGAYEHG